MIKSLNDRIAAKSETESIVIHVSPDDGSTL